MPQTRIAISMGDPAGIGPEITLQAVRRLPRRDRKNLIIVGSSLALKALPFISYPKGVPFLDITEQAEELFNQKKRQTRSNRERFLLRPGRQALAHAAIAAVTVREAARLACDADVQGLVTAPVHKTVMRLIYKSFHGHTEYLAQASRTNRYAMMFLSDRLKVTLVTIHVALSKVSRKITAEKIAEKIDLTDCFLKTKLKLKRPKLGVCALNPHGKETGTEEEKKISPAVQRMRRKGICVEGPFSADGLFHAAYERKYDALIAMYHDQALAPFKMIAFHEGTNVTLGLPFVRTSPDHGTAFDIAYQNKADSRSMLAAIFWAKKLIQ